MDEPARRAGSWNRRIEWDGPAVRGWIVHHQVALWLGVGVAFRLGQFLAGRELWLDESSLVTNLRVASPLAFFGPLVASQLAPPGFLVLDWLALRAVPEAIYGARLVPLAAGIATLWLAVAVARRVLPARAVPWAAALFASADDLIYFAAEGKQYSGDAAAALGCTWLGLALGSGELTARRAGWLAGAGGLIAWFSHPAAFVLAAVGLVGIAGRVRARDGRGVAWWAAIGAAWVASIAGLHLVAMRQLHEDGMMWRFWAFAFPPAPTSAWDASWLLRRGAYFFTNPLHFIEPFGPRWSSLAALGACGAGAVALGRARPGSLAVLVLPAGLVLVAAALRLYPFHGRLVLFLVPAALLLIAAGMDRVRDLRVDRGVVFAGLVGILVVVPLAYDLARLVEPRQRLNLNAHGDRRPAADDPGCYPF